MATARTYKKRAKALADEANELLLKAAELKEWGAEEEASEVLLEALTLMQTARDYYTISLALSDIRLLN